jgi:hypothetical protein
MISYLTKHWPSMGVFGGAFFWFLAHEIGFFFSGHACKYSVVIKLIHIVSILGSLASGFISYKSWEDAKATGSQRHIFTALLGMASAALFSIVILYQGIAAFIYSGCEV